MSAAMKQATPGPWRLSQAESTITVVAPWSDAVHPLSPGFGDYRGIHVATLQHHIGDGAAPKEHAEANARLIAAAPDMAEALRSITQLLDPFPTGHPSALSCEMSIATARAALAKAGL